MHSIQEYDVAVSPLLFLLLSLSLSVCLSLLSTAHSYALTCLPCTRCRTRSRGSALLGGGTQFGGQAKGEEWEGIMGERRWPSS
ncbi:hypothetical protein LZ30DRAFT_738271 [Colletotrichum cereale]|nr:hypothetical protein LZ30DRAFT_738271 [Colletotrichum cereale]